jgi:hypothetical protein
MRVGFFQLHVIPQIRVGLHVVSCAVFGERVTRFEGGAVEGVFGAKGILIIVNEIFHLLFPLKVSIILPRMRGTMRVGGLEQSSESDHLKSEWAQRFNGLETDTDRGR